MKKELLYSDKNENSAIQFAEEMKAEVLKALADKEKEMKYYQVQLSDYEKTLFKEEEKEDPNINMFAASGTIQRRDEKDKLRTEIYRLKEALQKIIFEISVLTEKKDKAVMIYDYLIASDNLKESKEELIDCDDSISSSVISRTDFGRRMLEAQEQERKRIAMDLHDSTVQNLTTLIHKSELITKLIDIDHERSKIELGNLNEMIRIIIKEMRAVIYDLRPMSLNDLGLVATIQNYIDQIRHKNNIQVDFKVVNIEKKIQPIINLSIYRILQEVCNNCIKHADATTIIISLAYYENEIVLNVSDNGKGFDFKKYKENNDLNKFGISMIEERVYLLMGSMDINSKKSGTEIIVKIPICLEREEKNESNKSNDSR